MTMDKREELLTKAKPILFNTEMVRAILDGRKIVTRRAIKPQPIAKIAYCSGGSGAGKWMYPGDMVCELWGDDGYRLPSNVPNDERDRKWSPPCNTDGILYVRETFTKYQTVNYIRCHDGRSFSEVSDGQFAYKADGYESIDDLKDDIRLLSDCSFEAVEVWDDKWHPSIHMPKEAARIFLKVTKVSVERLQDIDGYGILAEGVDNGNSNPTMGNRWENMQRMAFSGVWDSTVKKKDLDKYGWDADPWVWVVEFEKVESE